MTAASPPAARLSPVLDGRVALLVGLTFLVVLAVGLSPTILREQTHDWIAYDQAADRLEAGAPLYVFELATSDDEYYLYPPPAAWIWGAVRSPEALLALKLAMLVAVGALAAVAWPASRSQRSLALLAGLIAVAALIAPPDLHDIVLGNVMSLYIGAVALSLARPGWPGAAPLGIVCAIALKPVIGPYLVWLAIRRRSDAGRVVAVGLAVSAVTAALIGFDRYVEYLGALPRMTVLVELPTGNVGLSTISQEVAFVGIGLAYVVTVWAAARLDLLRGAAVAVAAGLLAQPSIGFNYAGLLLPAVVALWSADRGAGFLACLVVPLVAIVSTPLAALVTIGLAVARLGERLPGRQPQPASEPAA